MLQRAASNAYSWWWASHIRTKQSKWLEQCLQDMEDKVSRILKLIDDDGDSFAKRAEMYYKRRPELISSVEEAFKSFRALADRYDLLSKELQNANHTIATVFPEQVQFNMGEDDDFPIPKEAKTLPGLGAKVTMPSPPPNLPQVPDAPPTSDLKMNLMSVAASRQFKSKKSSEDETDQGLTKEEALDKIKKLQNEILALQTVKEFFKSSYENGVAKYWEVENQIIDMQQRVLELQDKFNVGAIIEDDEARMLMAETALKSCDDTLTMLQEKQDKLITEAREEYTRIETACHRVKVLRDKYVQEDDKPIDGGKTENAGQGSTKDVAHLIVKQKGGEAVPEKPKEGSDAVVVASLTMSQMVEKIDLLVNKVIGLETAVSGQNALVDTMKRESDDLHAQIQKLEDEKVTLINGTNYLRARLREMEEKLSKLQDLNQNVESQHSNLQTDFGGVRSELTHLSEKLSSVKPDEEQDETEHASRDTPPVFYSKDKAEEKIADHPNMNSNGKVGEKMEDQTDKHSKDKTGERISDHTCIYPNDKAEEKITNQIQVQSDEKAEEVVEDKNDMLKVDEKGKSSESSTAIKDIDDVKEVNLPNVETCLQPLEANSLESEAKQGEKEIKKAVSLLVNELDSAISDEAQMKEAKGREQCWQEILLSGVEDREMILLKEYTAILRSYKDVKKKLHEMEKKEQDSEFDVTLRMRELKKAILKRDEEIRSLRQRLSSTDEISSLAESFVSKQAPRTNEIAEDDNEIKSIMSRISSLSKVESKLRADIDAIFAENLEFWLRFSTAYHQVRKFKTEVEDLQNEAEKLKQKRRPDGSASTQLKSDIKAIKNHLREILTELNVWLDQSVSLKDELESRSTSLSTIQEEIMSALQEGAEEDEIQFSSLQAAKFQGEILGIKQENNKVREELHACLDHVKILQLEIDKMMRQLNEDFGISSDQPESSSRIRIPLRAFLFGSKLKKQKNSIFSLMTPSKRHHQVAKSDTDVHMVSQ